MPREPRLCETRSWSSLPFKEVLSAEHWEVLSFEFWVLSWKTGKECGF